MTQIIIIVGFLLLPLQAMSADCSSLASAFSKDPNALSTNELAAHKKCASDKLRERIGVGGPLGVPPPPVAVPAPAPAPRPVPPIKPVPAPAPF